MKTKKDAEKYLMPLYKINKPFIIPEKDYLWIRKVIPPNGYGIVRFMGEDVYFDTLKTKIKPKKLQCIFCKKKDSLVKFYVIPNEEEVKPMHPKCFKKYAIKNSL